MVRFSRSSQHRGSNARCGTRRNGRATRSDIASSARRCGIRPPRSSRLSTEDTSRSTSSGAARVSRDSRRRAWSPSSPSSPRAETSTLASTTITVLPEGSQGLGEGNRTTGAATGPLQDLLHRGRSGLLDQSLAQVLLQRLVGCGGSPAKHCMSLGGDVFHLHTRHSANIPPAPPDRLGILASGCQASHGALPPHRLRPRPRAHWTAGATGASPQKLAPPAGGRPTDPSGRRAARGKGVPAAGDKLACVTGAAAAGSGFGACATPAPSQRGKAIAAPLSRLEPGPAGQ